MDLLYQHWEVSFLTTPETAHEVDELIEILTRTSFEALWWIQRNAGHYIDKRAGNIEEFLDLRAVNLKL